MSFLAQEIAAKRFEPLRELVPKITKMALLVNPVGGSEWIKAGWFTHSSQKATVASVNLAPSGLSEVPATSRR